MSTSAKPKILEIPESPPCLILKASGHSSKSVAESRPEHPTFQNSQEAADVCKEPRECALTSSNEMEGAQKQQGAGIACSLEWPCHKARSAKRPSFRHGACHSFPCHTLDNEHSHKLNNQLHERPGRDSLPTNGISLSKKREGNVLVTDNAAQNRDDPNLGSHQSETHENHLPKGDDKRKGKAIISEVIVGANDKEYSHQDQRKRTRMNVLPHEKDDRLPCSHNSSSIAAGSSSDFPVYLLSPEYHEGGSNMSLKDSREYTRSRKTSDYEEAQNCEQELSLLGSQKSSLETTLPSSKTSNATSYEEECNTPSTRKRRRITKSSGVSSEFPNNHYDFSDVVFVGSSEPLPNNLSSTSSTNAVLQGSNCEVDEAFSAGPIDVDSFELRNREGLHTSSSHNTDARIRQIEEDELFARQLQEQLFNETLDEGYQREQRRNHSRPSTFPSGSVGSSRNHSFSSSFAGGRRRRDLFQPGLTRYSNHSVPTTPTSMRRSHMLGRFQRPRRNTNIALPRMDEEMHFNFPSSMDLDMRIDFLEAMEQAAEEGGIDYTFLTGVQRDFNENDYEMLLALDENNAVHRGASQEHINCLPTSCVQSDSRDEICSICLETPKEGDIIRHLLCAHRFHQNCIDPWLSRQATCPVCKSDV
eukprot:TRINITY_DN31137_c0_g1_i1.p1 TRINITY_DN31137_c0_g1~~TRINITY_DN31137_c0_g1_i1.p1  ORF type:complete len:644 (+),score=147.98 TRINITY_DN31137_c0_g1_i1:132-2063(+)